ncbi:MAG TPA: 2-amino-4-hydroxy-6-hydroxymethyldihydropteridine diphosphokinase [Polyangiaceae bacterium]
MLDAVVGIGSNLGDRRAHLADAGRRIMALGTVVRTSAIYETAPIGPLQPDYLNAALRLRTDLPLEELLGRLLGIERELGRVRRERWGPRVIDLDILWCLGVRLETEHLVVPHAELRARAFALVPLLDVAPDAKDPVDQTAYSAIVRSVDTSGVRELPETRGRWLV